MSDPGLNSAAAFLLLTRHGSIVAVSRFLTTSTNSADRLARKGGVAIDRSTVSPHPGKLGRCKRLFAKVRASMPTEPGPERMLETYPRHKLPLLARSEDWAER